MKKIILMLSVFAFLCQGCTDRFDRINRKYVLYNGTEHEVKVDIYERGKFRSTSSIKGKGVIDEATSSNDAGKSPSVSQAFGMDSVVVTYNNKKRQIYYYSDSTYMSETIPETRHDLLAESVYEVINNELYRFTFTEADYENAEEIGG
ncbi:hypothetical protein GCM10009122_25590 [Fulvivirga kasyanovii]|uniref:Uncharacterized protein n=1 Tax=Fulvivirga kasyanovii TaxID=396812 RepID=A0ABW9RQ47_9BACT|nr:hypothetical protein [Fulvivirga kasyanovii]MTI26061.1 hypothetical protein [Fulvivirga kasyanovii]